MKSISKSAIRATSLQPATVCRRARHAKRVEPEETVRNGGTRFV